MATNWQPPFGMPFPPPFPAPQAIPQQQSPPDGQSAPSDAYQPPPAFVPPAPHQAWSIPGLNFQAHNQNTQAAWPSNFPTPEQINQWTQMQMDMQQLPFMMMQNPPPIPGLGFASNPPPQSPFQNTTPTHPFPALPTNTFPAPSAHPGSTAQSLQNPVSLQNERIAEVMDSDKEEGELSEGDRVSQSPAANGRIHPEPPRSAPLNTAQAADNPASVRQEAYNPNQPAAGQAAQAASQLKRTVPTKDSANTLSQQRGDAKMFIKLLYNNNIGYHTLAAEDLDASYLRDLYRSLNLPSEREPVPSPPKANNGAETSLGNGEVIAARPGAPTNGSKPVTAVNTSVPPTKSVPSPVPAARAEYVKRLQAAKKGNQNGETKVTPPRKTPPPASAASKAVLAPPVAGTVNSVQPLTEAEKKAKNTELIRKRIEALKNSSSSAAVAALSKTSAAGPTAGVHLDSPSKPVHASPPAFGTSTPQNIPPSPFGNIPGLFMNSSPVVQSDQLPITPRLNNRKRPFPSNVDTPPLRDNIVHTQDNDGSPAIHAVTTEDGLQGAQTLPVIPGFQPRPASVNPSVSGMNTPGPQTPSSTARSQELDDKARKQAALKERLQKKIEEQKRESERRLASVQNSPNSLPQQTPALSRSTSGQEVARGLKRRRKVDVEAEQSALDTEIAENAAKLAQITKELELLTANDAKLRRDKERLQAELESFGIDTEGMPHAELQAKRDEIEREQEAALETPPTAGNLPTMSTPVSKQLATTGESVPKQAVPSFRNATQHLSQPPDGPQRFTQTNIPGLNASFPLASAASPIPRTHNAIDQQTTAQKQIDQSEELVPAKSTAIIPERHGISNKPTTPVDDEEDFYSPEPATVLPVLSQSEVASTSLAQAKSPSEAGEMAMSESEDEDYEPEETLEPQTSTRIPNNIATKQDATVASSQGPSLSSASSPVSEDEEPYEPPDVDQPMLDVKPYADAVESEPNFQQGEADEEEMDMSTSSDGDSDSDTSSESSAEELDDPASASSSKNPDSSVTIADDLAPELQPEASTVASASHDLASSSVTQDVDTKQDETNSRSFVPYESPLRLFKSYRYHPNFPQDVPSGYLSMTYSHQIDPKTPLCANETLGAPCNDVQCPDQHYRDMEISGEMLLVQLGTANPGKTPEERQRWNDGLRGVLKELRQKNTKDPNGIAMEIANYRRQFLQDDTRVVNL